MIKVTKILNLSGEGPFSYQWSTSNSCASFSKASDTTTGTIQTDIYFADEACFATAVISLTVISACGNSVTQVIDVGSPCEDLLLSGPNVTGDFTFSANLTGSQCTSGTFTWTYDTSLFSLVSQNDSSMVSTLKLKLKGSNPPSSTPIQVKVKDCKECERSGTLNYLFCSPTLPVKTVYLYSEGQDVEFLSGQFLFSVNPGCSTFTPDWNTISFTLPSGITITKTGAVWTAEGEYTMSAGTYNGNYSVKSTLGVSSQPGSLVFILVRPTSETGITLQDTVFTLDCDDIPGTIVDVPLNYHVTGSSAVDWSSFQIVTPPVPKASTISLGFDENGQRVIKYTVPNPVSSDTFSYTLCDTVGNCAQAGSISVIECAPPPVANDDTFSVVCGSTTNLPILSNDNGNGSPLVGNSVVITQAPTHGVITIVNGIATYVAESNYTGTDTFKYTVQNTRGALSNEATVTIDIACAGSNVAVTICN